MKILLVEDDSSTAQFLCTTLNSYRYTVDLAADGQIGLEMASQWVYDLIVLDVMIPRLDGISLCRRLRSNGLKTPILLLTAKGSNDDIVTGLDAGADDYLTKPFDLSQLLARIRALLRRREIAPTSSVWRWGNLCLDTVSAQVTYGNQDIDLRPKEYKLLEMFLRHPSRRVFSRNAIIDHLWSSDDAPTEGAVTNLIKDLRQKLKQYGVAEEVIETVYGLGYRLKPPPNEEPEQNSLEATAESGSTSQSLGVSRPNLQQGLAELAQASEHFRKSLPLRLARISAVERSLQSSTLTAEEQQAAVEELHKLVGGLGTFGYGEAATIAQAMEALLLPPTMPTSEQANLFSQKLAALQASLLNSSDRPVTAALDLSSISSTPPPVLIRQLPLDLALQSDPSEASVVLMGASSQLEKMQDVLQPWGIRIIHLQTLDHFWDVLSTISPNLLLLDLDSPEFDSLHLCKTLRQHAVYGDASILALTAHADSATIQAAFSAGVDDFIHKPIVGPEFVSRVVNRIERHHLLKPSAKRQVNADFSPPHLRQPLTKQDIAVQVLDFARFEQSILSGWKQAMQHGTSISLLRCSVAQSGDWGDRPLSEVTDSLILEAVARCLYERIQSLDQACLAHYGMGDFAILLPSTPPHQALCLAQAIQADLVVLSAELPVQPPLTVGIGVSSTLPLQLNDLSWLLTMTHHALCVAKSQGRSLCCLITDQVTLERVQPFDSAQN